MNAWLFLRRKSNVNNNINNNISNNNNNSNNNSNRKYFASNQRFLKAQRKFVSIKVWLLKKSVTTLFYFLGYFWAFCVNNLWALFELGSLLTCLKFLPLLACWACLGSLYPRPFWVPWLVGFFQPFGLINFALQGRARIGSSKWTHVAPISGLGNYIHLPLTLPIKAV